MDDTFQPLREAVQTNCHIADAHHAGEFTLCIYLLKMRELYRWEKGHGFGEVLPNERVGNWLSEREQLWQSLEGASLEPVPVDGEHFDPFHNDAINAALASHGLVYSGGLGRRGRPHFFLGRLERDEERDGARVLVSAEEFARDISAPPAMALGRTVYLRRESLQRLIWEKIEEWRWNRNENAMARAMACYDFEANAGAALETMTDTELESALLHELGEIRAGERLGEAWEEMLAELPRSKAEVMARAVRDHLADCLSTLPGLLERASPASLHFYFANLNGMRRELFPSLLEGYERWHDTGSSSALERAVADGQDHWQSVAEAFLREHHGSGQSEPLETLIDDCRL